MQDQTSESPVKAALHLGPIQVAVLALVGFIAIAGAIVTVVEPSTLSFATYSTQLIPELVAGLGILGIGKGLHLGLAGKAEQKLLTDAPDLTKLIASGQVAEAMARVQADIETEQPLQQGETLPSEADMAAAPPPATTELPPSPDPLPGQAPDLAPGTGLAADDPGAPPPPPQPSGEEVAAAKATLRAAGLTE